MSDKKKILFNSFYYGAIIPFIEDVGKESILNSKAMHGQFVSQQTTVPGNTTTTYMDLKAYK